MCACVYACVVVVLLWFSYKFAVYKNLGHLETVDQNRAGK